MNFSRIKILFVVTAVLVGIGISSIERASAQEEENPTDVEEGVTYEGTQALGDLLEERVAELEATTVRKGNRKVSLRISGQVNKSILFWDDGFDDDIYVVDGDNRDEYGSQVNFWGRARTGGPNSSYMGFRVGFGVVSVDSRRISQDDDDGTNQNNENENGLTLRYAYLTGGNDLLGQFSIGLNGSATYGITDSDLAGIGIVTGDSGRNIEGFRFRGAGGIFDPGWVLPSGIFWGDGQFERGDIIRYDSPSIAGFTLSAAWGEDDVYDAALRYAGEFGGFRVAVGAGFGKSDDDDNCQQQTCEVYSGSASIMHTQTGLFLNGAYGHRETELAIGDFEQEFYHLQAGLSGNWFPEGKSTIYGEYLETDVGNDGMNEGGEGEIWGVGFVHRLHQVPMDIYAGYRHYSVDADSGVDIEDFDIVISGARIHF